MYFTLFLCLQGMRNETIGYYKIVGQNAWYTCTLLWERQVFGMDGINISIHQISLIVLNCSIAAAGHQVVA